MMMRIARFLLACQTLTWLVATPAATRGILDSGPDTGIFRIGYRSDAKPYSYRNENAQPAGYIVDLCLEVAAAVRASVGGNVQFEFVLVPADQRFELVRDGKVDILCDPSSITMPRREIVDFSLPTFLLDGASVLYRMSKPVQRFEDLAGKRVGVLGGTTTEQVLRELLGELSLRANVVPVRDHHAGIDLLSDDKIDAYFADRAIIAAILKEGWPAWFPAQQAVFQKLMRPTRSLCRAMMVRSGCRSTARWRGFIAAAGSRHSRPALRLKRLPLARRHAQSDDPDEIRCPGISSAHKHHPRDITQKVQSRNGETAGRHYDQRLLLPSRRCSPMTSTRSMPCPACRTDLLFDALFSGVGPHAHGAHPARADRRLYGARRRTRDRQATGLRRGARPPACSTRPLRCSPPIR